MHFILLSRIINSFFHVKAPLFAWLLAGSWQSHEVVSRFCKQVILRSFSLTTTAASCSTIIWPLITSNSTLLGQNHEIVGRLHPPAAVLLLTDRRWKTRSHESAWLPPGAIRGVSAKLQGSKGKIRCHSSSPPPPVLTVYSLARPKRNNVARWSPRHIAEPAHASRLCKRDASQLRSAVTRQKSDWWDFIGDAPLGAELHSPPCQ